MEFSEVITKEEKLPVRDLLDRSGFFYPFEVDVVLEMMDETINRGSRESGYHWLRLGAGNRLDGFCCYGPYPCSVHSWDLYWLAVDPGKKNQQLGTSLLRKTEERVREMGGKILWIETSGRALYNPTVTFYLRKGYSMQATLPDFYGPGDSKLIFCKKLED